MKFPVFFLALLPALFILGSCQKSAEQLKDKLVKEGIPLNAERFIQAAETSDTLTMQRMLDAGMDANAALGNGQNALMTAAAKNHVHAMKLLVDHGAKADLLRQDGRNALHLAAEQGHLEATRFLLGLKLSAEVVDHQGRTPLVEAAANNHVEVMKLLLAASTDEKIRGLKVPESKTTAVAKAKPLPATPDEKEPVPAPVAKIATALPTNGVVPLVSPVAGALENGHEDLALQMIESGFEYRNANIQGQSLLAWAAATGQKKVFIKLLEKGADPDTRINTPANDLFTSKITNENFQYYVKKDKNVTVLMLLSALGDEELVDVLLLKGAKKGIMTANHETTAIYLASVNHHASIVQMLLGKSPKPEDQQYRIEISISKQRATIFKDGKAVVNTPISSGRKGHSTPKGTFVITDKYKDWVSTLYDAEMPFFLRLNCGPVGLHAGALPGYPASHGCIRLPYEKAKEFYGTVDVGTIVSIVD